MAETCPKKALVCLDIYKPPHCPRVLVVSKEGYCKKICPWCVSFELQIVQIPTYASVGVVGLDIDRCII